jgi:hypothetical protein
MIVSEVMPSPDCHDDPTNQHGTGFLSIRHGCQLGIEGLVSKRLGSRYRSVARLAQVQEPGGAGGETRGGRGVGPVTDLGSEVLSGVPAPSRRPNNILHVT